MGSVQVHLLLSLCVIMGHDMEGKHARLLLLELTSELANHALVLLECVLQDFLCRVHLPAPLGTHWIGVMSVRGRYQN